MDAAQIGTLIGSIAALLAASAGWYARKKISAEADKAKAERDSIIVQSATGAVALANSQMAALLGEQVLMRATVENYKAAVDKAVLNESKLRSEMSKLLKRIVVLEEFIQKQGLPVPNEA